MLGKNGVMRTVGPVLENDFGIEKVSRENYLKDTRNRLILLLGSGRSGTSWLAKILDTHQNVLYQHEPLKAVLHQYDPLLKSQKQNCLKSLVRRAIGDSMLTEEDRAALRQELRKIRFECTKPPFFAKDFYKQSRQGMRAYWMLARMLGVGKAQFRAWCRPIAQANYDILIKEVDWDLKADRLLDAFRPECLIVIVRHPCGVVNSRITGERLGLLPKTNEATRIAFVKTRLEALGITTADIEKMNVLQQFALDWMAQTIVHYELVQRHPCATMVLYEELCLNPLEVSKRLFDFLGWKIQKETENYCNLSGKNNCFSSLYKRIWKKRSYYQLTKNSMQAAMSWKEQLSPRQQDEILAIARLCKQMSWWSDGYPAVKACIDPA